MFVDFNLCQVSKTQYFLTIKKSMVLNDSDRIIGKHLDGSGSFSDVYRSKNGTYIIKFIGSRSYHERFKIFWLHSRFDKEIRGNKLLKEIGLNVPSIFEYGRSYNVFQKHLGYYVMSDMTQAGYSDLSDFLVNNESKPKLLKKIWGNIISDLEKMYRKRVVYSDLHFGNIMVNELGDIVWIDTGVTQYTRIRKEKLNEKFKSSIRRLSKQKTLPVFGREAIDCLDIIMK